MAAIAGAMSRPDVPRDEAIQVEVINRQRRHPVDPDRVERIARRALQAGGGGPGAIAILFASDRRLRELNRTYRGADRPTDVLSFPAGEADPAGRVHVGDIAISMDAAVRGAESAGCELDAEVDRLVTHGVLHLIGYDHEVDDGEMMALQEEILRENRREGLPR